MGTLTRTRASVLPFVSSWRNSCPSSPCILWEPSIISLWWHRPNTVSKFLPPFDPSSTLNFEDPLPPVLPSSERVTPVESVSASGRFPLWQPVKVDSPSCLGSSLSKSSSWLNLSVSHTHHSSSSSFSRSGPTFVIFSSSPLASLALPSVTGSSCRLSSLRVCLKR